MLEHICQDVSSHLPFLFCFICDMADVDWIFMITLGKRFLTGCSEVLCEDPEILVIVSLLSGILRCLPGVWLSLFLLGLFCYGRYQEDSDVTMVTCIVAFPALGALLCLPYFLLVR